MSTKIDYEAVTVEDRKKMSKAEMAKYLSWKRERDKEIVEGIFRFYECPGGVMEFVYKMPYKGETIEKYTMFDGQQYRIPRGVAEHLNNDCWYPEYAHLEGDKGTISGFGPNSPNMYIRRKIHRCGFQALDFIQTLEPTAQQLATI